MDTRRRRFWSIRRKRIRRIIIRIFIRKKYKNMAMGSKLKRVSKRRKLRKIIIRRKLRRLKLNRIKLRSSLVINILVRTKKLNKNRRT